ncbi:helix-turn-helix transcriptional regulator [Thalassospira alkalitolerans]|uniref:helix-turn-helix domain-containing protein n=1 Tax=Thalassospira alkalitolerans TaxID=1293890 RepID=UPI0030EF3701|tara:strand:- start:1206 stop:1640 length:435 start_codon:yes stop_codon:yes gene_type:complete
MTTSLSERIRQARKHIGLSASEAASLAGLTRKSWERYELDKNEPKASSLTILIDKGIDATWLLTGEGSMLGAEEQDQMQAIDPELLRMIIEEIEAYRKQHNPTWNIAQTARIVALGYTMLAAERQHDVEPNLGNLQILMQAANL